MTVLLQKMALMLILLVIGYVAVRLKIVPGDFNKGLSKLIINVLLVGMILSSVINKELEMTGAEVAQGVLMMAIAQIIGILTGVISAKLIPSLKRGDSGMYSMLIGFMNNGFMGFPLVAAFFGEDCVFFASLSNIPFNLMLYTIGIRMLQKGNGDEKLNLKRIINMPIIATLTALIIFVFEIPMPALVDDVMDTLSAAVVPLSMMCIGMSLGNVPIKAAVLQPKMYIVSLMRLIVAPLIAWLVLRMFITNPQTLGIIILLELTPSAVICTMLGLENGRDGVESSSGIFISTVLSVVTIPLMIALLGI